MTGRIRFFGVSFVLSLMAVGLAVERPPRDLSPEEAGKLFLSELYDQGHIRVVPMYWDLMPKIPPPYYDRRVLLLVPVIKGLEAKISVVDRERGATWSNAATFKRTEIVRPTLSGGRKGPPVIEVARLMIESLGPRKYPVTVEIGRGKERLVIRGEAIFGPGDTPDPVATFKLDGSRFNMS